ncbi:MAG: hypothetical protein SGJ00_10555 [bacterium]|nr:hypothetical protein [bacterium]
MGKQIRVNKGDERASLNFIEILDFIRIDSPTKTKRVKSRIINMVKEIPSIPEMYRADELKNVNDGTYRVFNLGRHKRII